MYAKRKENNRELKNGKKQEKIDGARCFRGDEKEGTQGQAKRLDFV
jgi:hypothetical protein